MVFMLAWQELYLLIYCPAPRDAFQSLGKHGMKGSSSQKWVFFAAGVKKIVLQFSFLAFIVEEATCRNWFSASKNMCPGIELKLGGKCLHCLGQPIGSILMS